MPTRTTPALSLAATLACAALACAAPALAQVRAADLWTEWQAQAEAQGQTLTAAQVDATDGGLELSVVSSRMTGDGGGWTALLDSVTLTENADGTVSIGLSTPMRVLLDLPDDTPDAPDRLGLLVDYENLDVTVGGPPGGRAYSYAADAITLTGRDDSDGKPVSVALSMSVQDWTATYLIDGADPENLSYASDSTVDSVTGDIAIVSERGDDALTVAFGLTGLTGQSFAGGGDFAAWADGPQALPERFDLDGAVAYESARFDIDRRDDGEAWRMAYANAGGGMRFDLSEAALEFGFQTEGASASASGGDLPAPVELGVGGAELRLAVPLKAADAPAPFSARLAYRDVTVGDALWDMADPMRAIPRDPASMALDIAGTVRLFADLFSVDPDTLDEAPGELRALTVEELSVTAAGVELTGAGGVALTGDRDAEIPVGAFDLRLAGGHALLDRLEAMRVVPAGQSEVMRGLADTFARPGPGPDTLETAIEFTADGGVSVNGLPFR